MRPFLAVGLVLLLAGCSDSPADDEDASASGDGASVSPAAEAGIVSGRLTAASPQQAIDLPIAASGHGRLAVTLVMTTNVPQSGLRVEVSGPGDRSDSARTSPLLYAFPGTHPTLSFADPPAGGWSADMELASGAVADFELHWCADDADAKGPQANLACHRDY